METVVALGPRALSDRVFCSEVEYQCEGFLEKNMDRVNQELINVLKRSKVMVLYPSTSDFPHRNTMSAPFPITSAVNSLNVGAQTGKFRAVKRCHLLFDDNFELPPSLQFDLLPKLLENDARASAAPHQHAAARTSCPGRHNVKTVGCQVRGFRARGATRRTLSSENTFLSLSFDTLSIR